MKKIGQSQPSYFEGMNVGDELSLINNDIIQVNFTKTSNESGDIDAAIEGRGSRSFEIEYDFNNFPTLKSDFIKRMRYLFLKDFSIPEFQNQDLKSTKLNLINSLDLGYGIYVKRTPSSEVPAIARQIHGEVQADMSDMSEDPRRFLPKNFLPDFIYVVYLRHKDGDRPLGVFVIPFEMADEVYDLRTPEDVRDFFINLAEDQLGSTIDQISVKSREKHGIEEIVGAFERLDTGHLTNKDILEYYNEKSKDLSSGSIELKKLNDHINELISRLHRGEDLTKNDLKSNYVKPNIPKRTQPIYDYKRMILISRLEKEINKIEAMFEQSINRESDEKKIVDLKKYYFQIKREISNIKLRLDSEKDIQKLINDINKIQENASNFIKK